MLPFLNAVNDVFAEKGIPLQKIAARRTPALRRRYSGKVCKISGNREPKRADTSTVDLPHSDNYYTPKGLDYAECGLITFWVLSAQGGCEPRITPEIMHEHAEKIVVHEPDRSSGHRQQKAEISFCFNVAGSSAIVDCKYSNKN